MLDVARGFAIVAMLIAHAAPLLVGLPRPLSFLQTQLNDVASPLFALTMGAAATVVLVKAGASSAGTVVLQNIIRGAILVALGLALAGWGSWIAIVLAFLGITLAIGTPLLLLRSRALIAVVLVIVLIGAPLNAAVAAAADPLWMIDRTPWSYVQEWLFLGRSYRVTNLLPFFLLGGLLMRAGFGGRRLGVTLLAVAAPLWLVRPVVELFGGASVSGSYPDTLHDAGLVAFVVGALILLLPLSERRNGRVISAMFLPLRAIGSVALSLYVLQVGLIGLIATGSPILDSASRLLIWVLIVIGVPLAGVLWWRFVGKGPLEWLIGIVSGRYRLRSRR